ncbi:MAG: hypothetical protein H6822_09555 [Planctomycetaceae bacterium]|nr:hypothetical protein [Planctomycetales bacterium]MCB9922416.1 hypothetical protein [Planctomycetaceae bacterium]
MKLTAFVAIVAVTLTTIVVAQTPARPKPQPDEKAPLKLDEKFPGVRSAPKKTVPADGVKGPMKPVDILPGVRSKLEKGVPGVGEKAPIKTLPENFEARYRQAYDRLEQKELSFEEYLQLQKQDFLRIQQLEKIPAAELLPGGRKPAKLNTACGYGDFEAVGLNPVIDSAEWSGAFGFAWWNLSPPVIWSPGLVSGLITDPNAHQTLISAGTDPVVGIQQTGPNTSTGQPSGYAVRIGNAVNGFGTERLSKTFTVTSSDSLIRFWYAVVLEKPQGHLGRQPFFGVRVIDYGTNIELLGLVNLGCANPVVADSNNPFFQTKTRPGLEPIVFKDWACAQIDLSKQVGKVTTVEFVTQDCRAGGHFGYAYVDNFCGTCTDSPTGDLAFDADHSTRCGKGNVCYNYTLPSASNAAGNVSGTAVITLDIYQNGSLLATLPSSPTLSTGTNYCFGMIDPTTIPGIDVAAGGIDLAATGTFTLGGSVQTLSVGTMPEGRIPGQNNDYRIACGDTPHLATNCCLGKNLVPNRTFDPDGTPPGSEYHPAANNGSLVPGTFILSKVEGIGDACRNWMLPPACANTQDFSGYVMLVNGLTNQPTGSTSVIWEQKFELPTLPGVKEPEYRICFRYLPLPQCCFDIQAKPNIVVTGQSGPIALSNVSDVDTGCGHLFSASFTSNSGAALLQIVLPEDGLGDGNDLLIDNISVVQLVKVPAALLLFNLQAAPGTGGTYDVTLTAPTGLTNPPYTWAWEMWDPSGPTLVQSVPGNLPATAFSSLTISTPYVFKLKAWSECNTLTGSKQTWSFEPNAKKAEGKTIEDPNPEPVTSKTGPRLPAKRSE